MLYRGILAMLAGLARCAWLRSRPTAAFDTACAQWNPEPVGTKGVPPFAPLRGSPRLRRVEQRAETGPNARPARLLARSSRSAPHDNASTATADSRAHS